MNYTIRQTQSGGTGNEKWEGFLYVSIRGGQQDIIQSHTSEQTIFNPACEYASHDVCLDLDIVMAYFALKSINTTELDDELRNTYDTLIRESERILQSTYYDSASYTGNLYDYCHSHMCLRIVEGELYDPIQFEKIDILDFDISNKKDPKNIDFTHNEAVLFEQYYWDNIKGCLLSPARPTNVFWSRHLSNMMQQNFTLDGYFEHQEDILARRRRMLENN